MEIVKYFVGDKQKIINLLLIHLLLFHILFWLISSRMFKIYIPEVILILSLIKKGNVMHGVVIYLEELVFQIK